MNGYRGFTPPQGGTFQVGFSEMFLAMAYSLTGSTTTALASILSKPLDPAGFVQMRTFKEGVCRNCTILASKSDLVYEDGTRVDMSNGLFNHGMVTMNLGTKNVANWFNMCATNKLFEWLPKTLNGMLQPLSISLPEPFVQYYAQPNGKAITGQHVDWADEFLTKFEVVNYSSASKVVYLQIDAEYVTGIYGKHVTVSTLTVTGQYPTSKDVNFIILSFT
jgi:hypothetical protein